MKHLCIVLSLLGQFQVEELPRTEVQELSVSATFLQEELPQLPKVELPKQQVDSRPVLDLLGANWCGACNTVKRSIEAMDPKSLPFIVRYHNIDSKGWLGASSIPAWAYNGRVIQYGYSTPENLMENFRKATQPKASVSVKPNNWPSYQGYKPRWTWPGDLRSHLRQVHGVTESLTQDQAEALHDALHEGYTLQQIRQKFK